MSAANPALSGAAPAAPVPEATADPDSGVLGLWLFIASEIMFFGPLLVAYAWGRMHYGGAFAEASRHTSVWLGTINTAVLLTSSAAMAAAVEARRKGDGSDSRRLAGRCLWGVAALGLCFLAVKGVEYHDEWRAQLLPGNFSAALSQGVRVFYFLYLVLTGLHAVHLGAGLLLVVMEARRMAKPPRGEPGPDALELSGLYWHFVDIVWIFLYPMLYLVGRST